MTALQQLRAAGVGIWLDDLSRARLVDPTAEGALARLISDLGVVGVTTNPTIFANAVSAGSTLYDVGAYPDVETAVRELTCTDVQMACDLLRPLYDAAGDGRVSIEVDPRLAHDTEATVREAHELWTRVDRPNLYIKVPATRAGLPAIRQLLSDGISINVTLIFSLDRYREVANAYVDALRERKARGLSLEGIASVASFFVSRVDTEVDRRLSEAAADRYEELRGQAAIANARLAYEVFEAVFAAPEWRALGAPVQRPLWASTGVKDPAYRDTRYVEELVAPHTVNTMPEATLRAFADHGRLTGDTATRGYDAARSLFATLADLGIDYDEVITKLEDEGVTKFIDSWNELMATTRAAMEASR
jgi:transaldolase